MKKTFLVFLLLNLFLFGCSPSEEVNNGYVMKVEKISIHRRYSAEYEIYARDCLGEYQFYFRWTDSIGKFRVGDTIVIKKK